MKAFASLLLPLLCCSCASRELSRFEYETEAMGTRFGLVLYAEDEPAAERAAAAAFVRIDEIDAVMSDHDPTSELSRLSRSSDGNGPRARVDVSPELYHVLSRAQWFSEETDGAFDVTIGPYVRLWRRSRRQGELHTQERHDAAARAVGHHLIELDPRHSRVRLLADGMRLDLGGIAKGYALDEALRVLRSTGIENALVDGGGDVVCADPPPGLEAWRVAIETGYEVEGAPRPFIALVNAAACTSGDALAFTEIDGIRYSHIIDPATGFGLTRGIAATVIATDALSADALASALCVMGPGDGLALIESHPGVEARVVVPDAYWSPIFESAGFSKWMVDSALDSSAAQETIR